MKHLCLCLWAVLLPALPARGDDLLLYAPFDGSADAAIARGDARNLGSRDLDFIGGTRGQAIVLQSDCCFATPGNFRPEQGTVAVWVRPRWNGGDATSHYVFCIYGQRDLHHAWAVNRWNVAFGDGKCAFTIFTQTEGKTESVSAPISNWKRGEWHHVAATWANVNSRKPDGEMKLYLDGAPADSLTGKQIDVGSTDGTMAIGRDQDGSPDYGNADFDDLFVYGRALAHTEVAQGVKMVKRGEQYDRPAKAGARSEVKGWWDAASPCRARVAIPAQDTPRENVSVQCPLALGADLAALGLSGAVDERSVRVVEESAAQPPQAMACVPARIENGVAEWQAPGPLRP